SVAGIWLESRKSARPFKGIIFPDVLSPTCPATQSSPPADCGVGQCQHRRSSPMDLPVRVQYRTRWAGDEGLVPQNGPPDWRIGQTSFPNPSAHAAPCLRLQVSE